MLMTNVDKIVSKILLLIVLTSNVSCVAGDFDTPVSAPTSSSIVVTSIATDASAPTTELLINNIQTQCMVEKTGNIDIQNEEALLLTGIDNQSLYMLTLSEKPITEEFITLDTDLNYFHISPELKQVAFVSTQGGLELVIANPDLSIIKKIIWKEEWGGIAGWVNDHQLLIVYKSDLILSIYNPQTVILFDVDTESEEIIKLDFPDLNEVNYVNWNLVNVVYSQDLTQVLYPTSKTTPDYINTVALWDVATKKVVAVLNVELSETTLPVWSPDGSQILVSGMYKEENIWKGQELFLIDKNGLVSQITNYSENYNTHITIEQYNWSPDGSKVAFWVTTGRLQTPLLMVLNINTGELTDYCISGLPYKATYPPIWSPSSTYLAINYQKTSGDIPIVLLLNTYDGTFTQISDNKVALGWLLLE